MKGRIVFEVNKVSLGNDSLKQLRNEASGHGDHTIGYEK